MLELRYFIKGFFLPPLTQLCLFILALIVWKKYPKLAKTSMLVSLLSLWLLSTSFVAETLMASLITVPPIHPDKHASINADAIVVLAGGQIPSPPEFGRSISSADSLKRLRYAAFLHKRLQLPILVSGGTVRPSDRFSLAETMAYELEHFFGIEVSWQESQSTNTQENAKFSFQILNEANKNKIVLVTHSLHMKRAMQSFQSFGFSVVAAPTGFISKPELTLRAFTPNPWSLELSARAIHEWLGLIYYRLLG